MKYKIFHPINFNRKTRTKRKSLKLNYMLIAGFIVVIALCWYGKGELQKKGLICKGDTCFADPIPDWLAVRAAEEVRTLPSPTPTPWQVPNADRYIDQYAQKFGHSASEVNMVKQRLHCLIFRESGYDSNKGKGDGGKAIGPFQFWQDTWNRMRKQMIKEGRTDVIGSPENLEQATSTTAWAQVSSPEKIKLGYKNYALEWGPTKRGECR